MKKTERMELESLTRELAQDYFVHRNYAKLLEYVSPKISWFGTGANEVCRSMGDAIRYLGQEREQYTGSFLLSNEWYHATILTDNTACVMAEMDVESDLVDGCFARMHLRFSVIYLRRNANARWKVCHLHNSVPFHEQGDATFFNQEKARKDYSRIQELALELAAEQVEAVRQEDGLTGVLNAEGFVRRAEALKAQYPDIRYALVKLGINRFEYINQLHGYQMGDSVLQSIADNLDQSCNTCETCGRIEKDTFAVLMEYVSSTEMERRLNRLDLTLLNQSLQNKIHVPVIFNWGIYLSPRNREENIRDMLDKALTAQSSVTWDERKSSFAYFNPQAYETQRYSAQLVGQAPEAMMRGEFKLYIQPQVDLKTMQVTAGEALTRWVRPSGEVIMPGDFITLFEREGQIVDFDFYMLELLCQHMRRWLDKGMMIKPISINQSRLHVKDPDYIKRFCEIVDSYGIPHDCLAFELTESAFTGDREAIIYLAKALHRKGFQLELDDFGSGYASLDLITTFRADVLKVDRSLLIGLDSKRNERARMVLQKVIELAHETGMTVICEGAETRNQVRQLKELDCDIVQGFYFHRPMPAEEFEREILRAECRELATSGGRA